jgi:hypothetical protein
VSSSSDYIYDPFFNESFYDPQEHVYDANAYYYSELFSSSSTSSYSDAVSLKICNDLKKVIIFFFLSLMYSYIYILKQGGLLIIADVIIDHSIHSSGISGTMMKNIHSITKGIHHAIIKAKLKAFPNVLVADSFRSGVCYDIVLLRYFHVLFVISFI